MSRPLLPGWLADLLGRARALVRRPAMERELSEEIRFHLEMETEANIRRGMTPDAARRAAALAFGPVERAREEHRDARGTRLLEDAAADLRWARRWLAHRPGFTVAVVLTLALGIGGTTAVVCVVDGVLLRPLPYPEPDRLVAVWSLARGETEPWASSPPDFRIFRERASGFERLGGYYLGAANLVIGGEPVRLAAANATAGTFEALAVPAAMGRTFRAEEETSGQDRVVVLSDGTWRRWFGARSDIIGSTVTVDGAPHTVIGVMPASFRFPERTAELWLPMAFPPGDVLDTRGNYFVSIIGRLRPGVSAEGAERELGTLAAGIAADEPQATIRGAHVVPLHEQTVGATRRPLQLLLGGTGLLLAITCANVAGLVLARGAARGRELALRAGLGATRGRLVRQLVTEGLLLSAAGSAAGLAVAWGAVRLLRTLGPQDLPRLDEVALDGRVLVATALISAATGLGFALLPALRLTGGDTHENLQGGARQTGTAGHQRLGRLLVGGQVALTLVLLVGAGLLLRSLLALTQVDPGFRSSGVVTASLPLRHDTAADAPGTWRFADELLERVQALPEVETAALTSGLSLRGGGWGKMVSFADRPPPASRDQVSTVGYRLVSPEYFRTLGVRLLSGRAFDPGDRADAQPVALINRAMARRFWPGRDPVGATIWMGPPEAMVSTLLPAGFRFPRLTVIGVVADERFESLDQPAEPEVYQLYAQSSETPSALYLAVRARGEPTLVIPGLRAALREVDPTMPLAEVATVRELMRESGARRRFGAVLISGFAALALALALVGVYGVAAQFVAQRRRELAIRIALGAEVRQIVRLVVREGAGAGLVGGLVGIGAALGLSGLMRAVVFEVRPSDPVTYAACTVVLLAAVLLAALLPARRAARLPPASVLGSE
jgi:putative ABC transport system permease protein